MLLGGARRQQQCPPFPPGLVIVPPPCCLSPPLLSSVQHAAFLPPSPTPDPSHVVVALVGVTSARMVHRIINTAGVRGLDALCIISQTHLFHWLCGAEAAMVATVTANG